MDEVVSKLLSDVGIAIPSLNSNSFTNAVLKLLHMSMREGDQFPETMPSGRSAKFRIWSDITKYLADVGFRNSIGFEIFLYPEGSLVVARSIFMFLLQNLPQKSNSETVSQELGVLKQAFLENLYVSSKNPKTALFGVGNVLNECQESSLLPFRSSLRTMGVKEQYIHKALSCAMTGTHLKCSYVGNNIEPSFTGHSVGGVPSLILTKGVCDEQVLLNEEDSREGDLTHDLDQVLLSNESLYHRIHKAETMVSDLQGVIKENSAMQSQYNVTCSVKVNAVKLCQQYVTNKQRLLNMILRRNEKFDSLHNEWVFFRDPLRLHLSKLEYNYELESSANHFNTVRLQRIRNEMKSMSAVIQSKSSRLERLTKQYNSMTYGTSRSTYLQGIMAIGINLGKQKVIIRSSLKDIRSVQRDINIVLETTNRCFASTKELLFSSARVTGDPAIFQIIQVLLQFENVFGQCIASVSRIGEIQNDVESIIHRSNTLKSKSLNILLKQVQAELDSVTEENERLEVRM